MSGIWPVYTGPVPDIGVRCPECGQENLAIFRTWKIHVWNTASIVHSPEKNSISGIWPGSTGHVQDSNMWCPDYDQFILALFRTLTFDVRNRWWEAQLWRHHVIMHIYPTSGQSWNWVCHNIWQPQSFHVSIYVKSLKTASSDQRYIQRCHSSNKAIIRDFRVLP